MASARSTSGFVIYRGPSLLNGAPIVAIATLSTDNPKTGPMVQTWILPDDGTMPHEHVKAGTDDAVCGDCKHRPALGGACYVRVFQGPRSVYAAFLRGRYEVARALHDVAEIGRGRMVRLGSYGDPAAVPVVYWQALVAWAMGRTGYTHQWARLGSNAILRDLVMASCDTPEEREEARAQGWRTFTVRLESDPLAPRESVCPASDEGGHKVTCAQCRACDGAGSGKRGSIAIIAHGGTAKRYREFRLAVATR